MRESLHNANIQSNGKVCNLHDDIIHMTLQYANMGSRNYIREWRDHRSLTQDALAERVGTSKGYLSQFETGARRYNQDFLERIAAALDCTPADLLGRDPSKPRDTRQQVPIVGKAAADAEGHIIFEDGYASGAHPVLEPFEDGSIATEIQGDSMWPRFRDRERVIWGFMRQDPTPFIGEDVLCRVTDGRVLIKTLARNKTTGNWNLISYNPRHPIIEDVKLEWVRPFEGLRH